VAGLQRQAYRVDVKLTTWNPDEAKWVVRHLWAKSLRGGSLKLGEKAVVVAALKLKLEWMRVLELVSGAVLLFDSWQHCRHLSRELPRRLRSKKKVKKKGEATAHEGQPLRLHQLLTKVRARLGPLARLNRLNDVSLSSS
jgi:hypothetical protein